MIYASVFKRLIDVLLATLALVLLSPVFAFVTLMILMDDGRPVIFRQTRVGRHGISFKLNKFRSMPINAPNVPSSEASSVKITRVGRFIRRTNIDELPQLWNILRGEMSLVGPRPALSAQASLVLERARRGVDALRPGLTGLAQVNSYDGMPENEKLLWDERYAAQVTFLRDLSICAQTFIYLTKKPPRY